MAKKLTQRQQPQKPVRATDLAQKMVDPTKQEGQVTTDPAPNPTQRRKMLPTGTAMEEAAKEKTDGGGRQSGLGHQVNS